MTAGYITSFGSALEKSSIGTLAKKGQEAEPASRSQAQERLAIPFVSRERRQIRGWKWYIYILVVNLLKVSEIGVGSRT